MLTLIYKGDLEPEKILILLRRFQAIGHLPGSPPPIILFGNFEGYFEEEPFEEEVVMVDNEIIGIANDRARKIRDYIVFDPNSMNTRIMRPYIIMAQFEFKPMVFKMLQEIGQYSGATNEDPCFHSRQFLEVASNFKIP